MVEVKHYKRSRHWAVYRNGKLLCVTVYKKGAMAVKRELEALYCSLKQAA